MSRIFYGKGAYKRSEGNLPELKLINMFVEQSSVEQDQVVLLSRKGLVEQAEVGSGPVRGVFQEDGVFGGETFTVSGTEAYRGGTLLGTITGNGPVSFAASATELGICAGDDIFRYDGTTFGAVAFPDGANVRKIAYHDGLFFAIRDGTDTFYASDVLDLATWDALSFKSAESAPDKLLDMEVSGDVINFFGSKTTEPWANNDSADTVPYSRQELAIIDKGVKATGCVVKLDQALFFVSNENMAMALRGGAPERISDNSMEERIAGSASVSTFGYVHEGHSVFVIRLDSGSFGYDVATGQWHEGATLGLPNWLIGCATKAGNEPLFGSVLDGKLYAFGGWADGAYPLTREFTAGIPVDGGAITVDALSLTANPGWTEELSGQGSDPQIEMRFSRDGGATWSDWRKQPLGKQGEYRTRQRWRRLGMFDEPGALFHFRMTDPVGLRVSAVRANDPGGGRSR